MPMSESFKERLFPSLPKIVKRFGTPFHIYDETGILQTGRKLISAFNAVKECAGFQEFFAVKALPNPEIMKIMRFFGFGFDCSSIPELTLSRQIGATGEEIIFTSNNTTKEDLKTAMTHGGSIINLDDISLIDKLPTVPEMICFRYNPGPRRTGNDIIGNPIEAKYGVSHEQIIEAYRIMRDKGVKRFGLHTMLISNERDYTYMAETVRMLLDLVTKISDELGICFEFINMGGGLGIPYKPTDKPLNISSMGRDITIMMKEFKTRHGWVPALFMESGRYITGPHGALVTRAINEKNIYRRYIGVDACMSSLMRPGMYGAYHHIDVLGKNLDDYPSEVVDVVGSLCENIDKFAVERPLPKIVPGDLLIIQDTGAHGHAMGFNYNARLRPKELLLRVNGSVDLIRRAETQNDYFATLNFEQKTLKL